MKKRIHHPVVLILLALILCVTGIPAARADETVPYSSRYIFSYYVSLSNTGEKLEVFLDVTGMDVVNDLGAHTIIIQRSRNGSSWTNVKAFYYTDAGYSHMMGHQTRIHQAYVTYAGTSGYYYRALVKVWGGDGTSGDMFPAYTNVVQL